MGNKRALLIGTQTYIDPTFHRLVKPNADVASLASTLQDSRIGGFDVQTSIDEPFASVLRKIGRLYAESNHDDLLLLYFAGHGVKDEQGQLHLATTDTDASILHTTALGADYLTSVMNRSRSRKQILILDCCFSGAATGTRATTTVQATSTFGDATGRIILTATDSFQYAWETDATLNPENSIFTHFLVEGLATGKADADQDGVITADEWYDYVYAHVRAASPKQTPQRSIARGTGTLVIAQNAFLRISLPTEITIPMASVLPSVREGTVYELSRLLTDARLTTSARDALEQLSHDRDARVRRLANRALAGEDLAGFADLGASDAREATPASSPTPPAHSASSTSHTDQSRHTPRYLMKLGGLVFRGLGVGALLLFGFLMILGSYGKHTEMSPIPPTTIGIVLMLSGLGLIVQWRRPRGKTTAQRRIITIGLAALPIVTVFTVPLVSDFHWLKREEPANDTAATETVTSIAETTTSTAADTAATGTTGTLNTDTAATGTTSTIADRGSDGSSQVACYAQLESTPDQQRAEALAARLINGGFTSAYVDRGRNEKGVIFRVRVKFASEREARAAEEALHQYAKDIWIIK